MSRICFLLAIAGCAPPVPDQPSFQLDVFPLLAANCVRCHGTPPLYDAPPEFRLDTFGQPGDALLGAADVAQEIKHVTGLDDPQMPHRYPLDGWQIETFERWAATPVRGEPRAGNRVPHAIIERTERSVDRLTVRIEIEDTDGDPVGGELRAMIGTEEHHVGNVRSGVLDVTWTTTGIPAGDYPLAAHLDDGAQVHVIPLGALTIGGP